MNKIQFMPPLPHGSNILMLYYRSESRAETPGIFSEPTAPPSPEESWELAAILGGDKLDCRNAKVGSLQLSLGFGEFVPHV